MRTSRAGAEYGASASNDTSAALQNPRIRALAEGKLPQTRHLYKGPWYSLSSQGTPEETYKRALVPSTVL